MRWLSSLVLLIGLTPVMAGDPSVLLETAKVGINVLGPMEGDAALWMMAPADCECQRQVSLCEDRGKRGSSARLDPVTGTCHVQCKGLPYEIKLLYCSKPKIDPDTIHDGPDPYGANCGGYVCPAQWGGLCGLESTYMDCASCCWEESIDEHDYVNITWWLSCMSRECDGKYPSSSLSACLVE